MMYLFLVAANLLFPALAWEQSNSTDRQRSLVSNSRLDIEIRERKWISEIMAEAEMMFNMHANVSTECKRDFELYKHHVRKQTVWAVRMMESSEWPRVGLLSGGNTHFGHWSECLKSEGPGIRGQYCLVQTTYNFTLNEDVEPTTSGWVDFPDETASAWKVIRMYETIRIRVPRQTLTWAMCIPSSCNAFDLQMSIDDTLRPLFESNGLNFTVMVDPISCNVHQAPSLPRGHHYTRLFFTILIAFVISATVYELTAQSYGERKGIEDGLAFKLFRCFSAVQSCKTLTHHSSNTYLVLYFLKTLSAVVNILGHTIFFRAIFPDMNAEEVEMECKPWSMEPLLSNIITVFVVISGFLTTFHFDFTPKNDFGINYLILSIIFRWLRMIPVLGMMILFMIFILPYANDGPLWNSLILSEAKYCSSNWWTNMLALNNLINRDGICFRTSWYITVDMQLSIIGVVLLLITKKNKKLGFLLMFFAFIYSLAHTFLAIFLNEYDGLRLYIMKEILKVTGFFEVYISTYYRLGPYLVGCATAILTRRLMSRKYKFSRIQTLFLLPLLFLIGIGVQFYALLFLMVGRPYCAFENAIFGTFNGTLFALPVAGLICIYFVSGLGILNRIFEIKIFLPIGRLGYCMYLVSFIFQKAHIASQKKVLYHSGRTDIYWFGFLDVVTSILLAFLLFLISEGPISNMTNLLRMYLVRKEKSEENVSINKEAKSVSTNGVVKSVPTNGEVKSTSASTRMFENENDDKKRL